MTAVSAVISLHTNKGSIASISSFPFTSQPSYFSISYCLFLTYNLKPKTSTEKTNGCLSYRGLFQSLDN